MIARRQFIAGPAVASGALAACREAETKDSVKPAYKPQGQKLSAQDLEDALTGSSYLGCGGGLAEVRSYTW